jgi:hypothetical protein
MQGLCQSEQVGGAPAVALQAPQPCCSVADGNQISVTVSHLLPLSAAPALSCLAAAAENWLQASRLQAYCLLASVSF